MTTIRKNIIKALRMLFIKLASVGLKCVGMSTILIPEGKLQKHSGGLCHSCLADQKRNALLYSKNKRS